MVNNTSQLSPIGSRQEKCITILRTLLNCVPLMSTKLCYVRTRLIISLHLELLLLCFSLLYIVYMPFKGFIYPSCLCVYKKKLLIYSHQICCLSTLCIDFASENAICKQLLKFLASKCYQSMQFLPQDCQMYNI
jgi:hypothetical protein